MSLRWRLALILAAVALAVSGVAAAFAWLTTSSQLNSTIDDSLRATARNLDSQPPDHGNDHGGDHGPSGINCPPAGSFQPASAAQIVEPDGTVLPCINGGVAIPVSSDVATLGTGQMLLRTQSIGGHSYRLLSTPWREGGTLQIARSLSEASSILDRLRLELLALACVVTLVTAALGWAVATRVARPIMRLRDTTEHIASSLDFSISVPRDGAGEVRSLADSFRTMMDAVRGAQEKQRRLVADASHEMRTPLTSLRSNVELLGKIERLPVAERAEVVGEVLDDIDELSHLMGELVDLASDLAEAEPAEPVFLGDLARTVAARAQRRLGRDVTVEEITKRTVTGRPRQLERALSNLVDNATKYSADGTPVQIVIEGAKVTVNDRGRGLHPDDVDRIFDRFYRAVDVRTEPGSGLGLAIVEEIARSHGGEVFATNREGGGAAVGFSLPEEP